MFRGAFLIFATVFLLIGCEKRDWREPVKIHWDRDSCERCNMAISERKYAVEVIDPNTKKHYLFDDIGCAVLWFDENNITWSEKATVWITDAKSGEWINAKVAKYSDDKITPMAFGIAAFSDKTFPKGFKPLTYEEIKKIIRKIEEFNKQRNLNR